MKVTQRDGTVERQVLIGMLVSKKVLGAVTQRWTHTGLFSSKHANLLGLWATQYYKKYNKQPKDAIEALYHEWADTQQDHEVVKAVGVLLSGLLSESERVKQQFSPDHLLDMAGKLFESVRLKDLISQMSVALDRNDMEHARSLMEKSRKIELGLGSGISVLSDESALERAFMHKNEVLLQLPGAMGNFYGNSLCRGGFIAVLAAEKKGKSRDLQDLAWRGVQQGLRVAYFEMGDHIEEEVMIRFASRATGRPYDPLGKKYLRIPVPIGIETKGEGEAPEVQMTYEDKPTLTLAAAKKCYQEMVSEKGDLFHLWCHPSGTLSVTGVDAILDEKKRDGWTPDILVLDYLDLAAPIERKMDKFEAIDQTWIRARGLSQKWHCLVLTATQANRQNNDPRILTREDIGGYHMKLAHVTGMVGINQSPKEKQTGLSRRNWVARRDLDFSETMCVWYAGCPAVANPCLHSTF